MQGDNFNKTPHILLLFWRQFFTKIFTGKMILPMVLPVNRWYGKFSKFTTLNKTLWNYCSYWKSVMENASYDVFCDSTHPDLGRLQRSPQLSFLPRRQLAKLPPFKSFSFYSRDSRRQTSLRPILHSQSSFAFKVWTVNHSHCTSYTCIAGRKSK